MTYTLYDDTGAVRREIQQRYEILRLLRGNAVEGNTSVYAKNDEDGTVLTMEEAMKGPWSIVVRRTSEDPEQWRAEVVIEELAEQTSEASTAEEAIQGARDGWAATLHEDFGPQDFTVTYADAV